MISEHSVQTYSLKIVKYIENDTVFRFSLRVLCIFSISLI